MFKQKYVPYQESNFTEELFIWFN